LTGSVASEHAVVRYLATLVGAEHVRSGADIEDYEHDGTFLEAKPTAVVLPGTTNEVAEVVRFCAAKSLPLTARGAGTGLSGGPVPLSGGIVLGLERMRGLTVDAPNLCASAEAGVVTADLQEAAAQVGLMYPPDPASYQISTIGGNVACNSGGMCCLKYGVTADYVIGMTVVLASGDILRLGGKTRKRASGYRLISLFIGSEGTLGIVTELIVKLVPRPRSRRTALVGFAQVDDAAAAIESALRQGFMPAALEFMDGAALKMVAEYLPSGFPSNLAAALIIEQDGHDPDHVEAELLALTEALGGVDNRVAQSESEREKIWKARRQFGNVLLGMRHNFFVEDVAVPISSIPTMIKRFHQLAAAHGVEIVTVGHAGDGNLHPTILFREEQRGKVGPVAAQIFLDAIELGGTISAEHGLGALKRDHAELEHGHAAIALMRNLKTLLDPAGILNPHKVLPEGPADGDFLNRLPGWGAKLASGKDRMEFGA
jgi:glycolate oxidase